MTLDIRKLAEEAGLNIDPRWGYITGGNIQLQAFADAVLEACIDQAQSFIGGYSNDPIADSHYSRACLDISKAIRALKSKP